MFEDILENKKMEQDIDFDKELVRIEKAVREVSKSFHELLGVLPQAKNGLSGVCGDWPTDDSMKSRIDRVVLGLYVTRIYMEQITKRIQGEICQTN